MKGDNMERVVEAMISKDIEIVVSEKDFEYFERAMYKIVSKENLSRIFDISRTGNVYIIDGDMENLLMLLYFTTTLVDKVILN